MSIPDTRIAVPREKAAVPRPGAVFAVVAAGVAMSNLDVFIVNVALPQIGERFASASLSSLSWVLNAYAVVFAALLVPAGRFADRTGPRRAYLVGIGVFTVASAACAAAPDVWSLVAARAVQAAGAALAMPSSLGLLLAAAPADRRVPMVRAWTAISGLAAALGPVAGGLLTELDWRWVFLVNVPVGVAVLLWGPRLLPRPATATPGGAAPSKAVLRGTAPAGAAPGGAGFIDREAGGEKGGRSDLVGAAALTAGVAALALGVVKSDDWGWGSGEVVGALVAALVLLVAFMYRSARHPAPVLPLPLFRVAGFGPGALANVIFAVAFAAMLLSAVLWCQQVWHWSALRTGLAVAPGPLMVPALAVGVGPVVRRLGAGPVAAVGCLAFAGGIAWWAWRMAPDAGYAAGMLPGMLLTGIGVGVTLPTLIGASVAALPPHSFATGSGVLTMARQIGTVLGIAMLVAALGTTPGDVGAFDDGWLLTLGATAAATAACLFVRRPRVR